MSYLQNISKICQKMSSFIELKFAIGSSIKYILAVLYKHLAIEILFHIPPDGTLLNSEANLYLYHQNILLNLSIQIHH